MVCRATSSHVRDDGDRAADNLENGANAAAPTILRAP